MSDIDSRVDKIERQVQRLVSLLNANSNAPGVSYDGEIDLKRLWNILWCRKWWIASLSFLFAFSGGLYASILPNMYKSEGVYAAAQKQAGNILANQVGGLAAMAGINLNSGDSNDIEQAMTLVTSWPFLEKVIDKYHLKPMVVATKGWDSKSGSLIWNEEMYDPRKEQWLSEPSKDRPEPSSYETYKKFVKMLKARFDPKVGMITISVEFYSPVIARQWVQLIVDEINQHFQLRDISKAQKSIQYLERKVNETSIAGMQSVFYGMIEVQTKTLMLAEVDENYLLVAVVDPQVAEVKSSPKRMLIVFMFAFFGSIFAVVVILMQGLIYMPESTK